MEEAELIKRSRDGDVQAFNVLVNQHQKEVLNFAFRMLGNLPDAEDICQNSWIAAWKSIRHFRGDSFLTWVLTIVAHDCHDEFRQRKVRIAVSVDDPPMVVADPKANHTLDMEITEAVQQSMLELPHEQRLAVTLREFNNLSYDEIAGVMKCSVGTVRSRLNRGRINLRNHLRDKGFLG